MNVNYNSVCRLCLSSRGELQPIFPTTSSDDTDPAILAVKIKECVSVHIIKDDKLPSNVCRKCLDNVNNWHKFKSVCEKAQNKLQSMKEGSLLEEVKSVPFADETYDDGVVIDGNYPEIENAGPSKLPEAPPPHILASLGLTPKSDKGGESEKEEQEIEEEEKDEEKEDEEEEEPYDSIQPSQKAATMPEVSITVMRPTGETLQSKQGIAEIASKDCLVCGRVYRYSHNARRHELASHNFDRYTNKISSKKPQSVPSHMLPKLRPNPFNPKARLLPNPINNKVKLLTKPPPVVSKAIPKPVIPSKPVPVKQPKSTENNLPYPLRIKALKDLQIRKREPQILKTLLTSKPEILVSEPEIMNSGPASPETLISEPEIASFAVETILTEPDEDEEEGLEDAQPPNQNYDTVDMNSDNEIEIARQQDTLPDNKESEAQENGEDHDPEIAPDENGGDNENDDAQGEMEVDQQADENSHDNKNENHDETSDQEVQNDDSAVDEDGIDVPHLAPVVEINEGQLEVEEGNDEEEDLENTADPNNILDPDDAQELDPNKQYVTKTQKEFIAKYRDIIEQINTMRCLCCDREHPRRKSMIQHLQKNGHKVPKHTCYNCIITFSHLGALLSHMRANVCSDLWKIIYNENGITDDMVLEEEPKVKVQYKDIFNARSYACKLCPAKFQLKQFIMKHVLDVHEDGQSQIQMICVHCGSRFKERAMFKKHIRNGDCTVDIACDLCPEKFKTLHDFNDHALAVHSGDFSGAGGYQSQCVDGRRTDCPTCDKACGTYASLVKHLKVVHNEEKPYYCQHCDAKYEESSDLDKHIYTEHSDRSLGLIANEPDTSVVKEEAEEYHYSCTECNAIFETVDAWTDHQVAEHNQVAHHCDQCEKKFLRPSELAEHKNTHLRVKFYPCNICSNSYSTPQKLADHVKQTHPGAKNSTLENEFHCVTCVRAFKSRQAYSNHMRIHSKVPTTNRKPGVIDIIGKPIKQFPIIQGNIPFPLKQTASNVPEAPYCCDICGKGFMHKKNIWKHKKVLHADLVNENRNDSEDNNTMHASTEDDEYQNVDENGIGLTTPQFDSFNFTNFATKAAASTPTVKAPKPQEATTFACDICNKKFPHKANLYKHKRVKHGIINPGSSGHGFETNLQIQAAPVSIAPLNDAPSSSSGGGSSRASCTICKVTFSDKKSYYRHRKNVHRSTAQMCKICGKPLNSTLDLYEHLKAAHARELLGYNANQSTSKVQEFKQEPPEYEQDEVKDPSADYQARYPCDACGKQFVGLLALQNHQCLNNQVPPTSQSFDCEICNKSYSSVAALKSHRGWHLRSPDGKAAANNSGLWMPHRLSNKSGKNEVLDALQFAKVTHSVPGSSAKRRLPPEVEVTVVNPNKKMRSDDYETDPSMAPLDDRYCTICDKEFTKRAAYQRHMDEVHKPNSVFCPVCGKSFTRKSTLFVHMRKHYGGDGGEASSSLLQQEDDGDLDEEMEEEEEEEGPPPPGEFTCGQCGDGVATPRDLIAHRSMHATPTKFFCNTCKVYFATGQSLAGHTRNRHADNEKAFFPCAMCDRFYMNKKSLQQHIEMSH